MPLHWYNIFFRNILAFEMVVLFCILELFPFPRCLKFVYLPMNTVHLQFGNEKKHSCHENRSGKCRNVSQVDIRKHWINNKYLNTCSVMTCNVWFILQSTFFSSINFILFCIYNDLIWKKKRISEIFWTWMHKIRFLLIRRRCR